MSSKSVPYRDSSSWSARFSRQTPRRALVWAWAVCCVAFLTLGSLETKGVVWFFLFAATFVSDVSLYMATHRLTDQSTSALDERQQGVRNRAFRSAYVVVSYGLLLVVGGALLLFTTGSEVAPGWISHLSSHPAVLTGFGVATMQLVSLLPTAFVAWTEPDEPNE